MKIFKESIDKHNTLYYIILGKNMENKITQLRKGILELAVLGSLHHESHYGYSLIRSISGESELDITEGTVYPILSRLLKEELIKAEWVESNQGPPRKYYSLTPKGERAYEILMAEFNKLASVVAHASKKPEKNSPNGGRKILEVKKEVEGGE